jgi:LEA14-like dessication related protein
MKRFAWITALLVLTGCATFTPDEDFDVSLVNVTSGEVQPWETTLVFTVRLQNARPQPVTLAGASHRIYLDGSKVGTGLSSERITIPALSDVAQQVTVRISNFNLALRLHAASQTGRLSYEVRSTLYQAAGGGIRAQKSGTIDFSGLIAPGPGQAGATPPSPKP